MSECDAPLSMESRKGRAEPGRRLVLLAGQLGDAAQTLIGARHVNAELRAATARGAELLYRDGEVDAAHRVLVAAMDNSWNRPDHDIPGVVEALHALGTVCYFGGRSDLWAPFQRTLDLLGDVAPPVLRLIARTCSDPVAAPAAALLEVDRHIHRLQTGDLDPAETVHIGMAAHAVDRLPDCRTALRRVFLGTDNKSANDWAARAGLLLALDAVDAGQWAEAETLADQCIGLCETSGQRLWAWSGRYVLALVAAGRGQWNDCRALTSEMVEWAAPRGVLRLVHDAHHARFLAALGRGDHDANSGAVPPQGTVRIGDTPGPRPSLDAVEAAVRTRQLAAAMTHASALADTGAAQLPPRLALRAASAEALVAPAEQAVELFQAALDIPGIDRWPFEVARVQLAFGERLRRRQATRASREQLTTALDTFTRLGAQPWADRANAELRATGQTRRRSDGTGPSPLTPQELGIAELAATGLTNKQIGARLYLSPRTVSAHLYRVFPKLGITSRAALRDALAKA